MSTSYEGVCHCGQTAWKADLNQDLSKHILW